MDMIDGLKFVNTKAMNKKFHACNINNKIKTLGMNGDKMFQIQAFEHFVGSLFGILVAPTGCGKSLIAVAHSIVELTTHKHTRKIIFAVPQLAIASGFDDIKNQIIEIPDYGVFEWKVENNFCDNSRSVVKSLKNFIVKDYDGKFEEIANKNKNDNSPTIVGGKQVAIVSYSALVAAFNKMSEKEKIESFSNITLIVDEAHHSSVDDFSNGVGEVVDFFIDHKSCGCGLFLTTATFFRNDQKNIIRNIELFDKHEIQFSEHWNSLQIEEFSQTYVPYCENKIKTILEKLTNIFKKHKNGRFLFILPKRGIGFFRYFSKDVFLKELLDMCIKEFGEDKIIDLIRIETQEKNKKRFIEHCNDAENFKCVISCEMAKEGIDWTPCDVIVNFVDDGNNLQTIIQKNGRLFRYFPGKNKVAIYNFFYSYANDESLSLKLNEHFNIITLMTVSNDIYFPIKIPVISSKIKKLDKNDEKEEPILKIILNDILTESIKRDLVFELLSNIEKIKNNKEKITNEIVDNMIISIIEKEKYEQQISAFETTMELIIPRNEIIIRLKKEIIRIINPKQMYLLSDEFLSNYLKEKIDWDNQFRKTEESFFDFKYNSEENKNIGSFFDDKKNKIEMCIDLLKNAKIENYAEIDERHPLYGIVYYLSKFGGFIKNAG